MCTEDSPSGLWRTLGKRVGCKPSGVRIPHPPPPDPGTASGSGVFVACTPPDLRPPRVLPARESSAPRASLGASSRSPARPRRPRGGLQSGGACRCEWPGPAAARGHRSLALCLEASPGLVPLDSEALDDLCARERGQDLARHKELRSAQARADAAPSDRARRVDEEPP